MKSITTWSVLLIRPRVSGDELNFTSVLTPEHYFSAAFFHCQ